MNKQYLLQHLANLIGQLDTNELIEQFKINTLYLVDSSHEEIQLPIIWDDNAKHILNLYIFRDNTLCLEYQTTNIYDSPDIICSTSKFSIYSGLLNSDLTREWI